MLHLPRTMLAPFLALTLTLALTLPARAVTLIRDPDIEHALAQLARPVFSTLGLPASSIKILIVQDNTLNAYVTDSRHIFLHSGLILKMTTPEMLQSVIAHEAAHIANGHITRRLDNARTANTVAGLGAALALAAAASGNGNAAGGIGLGISSSATRVFLGHTRAEESAADSTGLRAMSRAGLDPKGYADVLQLFRGQEMLLEHRQDPYARSHPLSRDRLRAVEALTTSLPAPAAPDAQSTYWFARAQGKLSAFLRAPSWTLRRTGTTPAKDDITLMRQAVAYHRTPDTKRAIAAIDALAAMRPKDPFVHELRGQILLESRSAKAATAAYQAAARLAPDNAQILGGLGRALLASGNAKAALPVLEKSRARDFGDARVLRDLATAYAKTGQMGQASLATAERYALQGAMKDALLHATRAEGLLPRGSPSWLRAQDVIFAAQAATAKNRR